MPKRKDIFFRDVDNAWISGAITQVAVVRVEDGYFLDSTGAFVASPAEFPSATENPARTGHFYHDPDVSSWEDGNYYREITVRKIVEGETVEGPYMVSDMFTISGGIFIPGVPEEPSADGYCRVYFYAKEPIPSTLDVSCQYWPGQFSGNVTPQLAQTGVYNAGNGLWYVDLIQGMNATIRCAVRYLSKSFCVPGVPLAELGEIEPI